MADEVAPLDIPRLMRDLEESGRRRRLVEAERPSADYVGEVPAKSVVLSRKLLDASRNVVFSSNGEGPDGDYGLRYVAGSLAEQDATWLASHLSF